MRDRIDHYLLFLRDEEAYSENTTAAYRNDLGQFAHWYVGLYPNGDWRSVTSADVADYLVYLLAKEYAPSTVARKIAALKSFFKQLAEREEIVENPTADIDTPKVEKGAPLGLTRDSISRLMQAPTRHKNSKGLRDCAMLELLYATGIRVSELVNLRVDDFDREARALRCGNGATQRFIPISPRAQKVVEDYLDRGRTRLIRTEDEPIMFLNMRGQALTRQGLWLIIKYYVDEAGVKDTVTPHTLRHSFAIHRIRGGAELTEVKELLGHANISTTQVYANGRESKS